MSDIFIFYHPRDSKWFASRLFVTFSSSFGSEKIRLGIEALRPEYPGFEDRLQKALDEAAVFVILMGREWRRRWIYNTNDPYHQSLSAMIGHDTESLLLLVDEAEIPYTDALMGNFKKLHDLPSMQITRNEFLSQAFMIVNRVKQRLEAAGIDPTPAEGSRMVQDPYDLMEDEEGEGRRREGVIISYNKADTGWMAGRFQNILGDRFGYSHVLLGVQSVIYNPADAVSAVEELVRSCAVFIVLVGDNLLQDFENPLNFDRMALAVALRERIDVLALMVNDTEFPATSSLPGELQLLAVKKRFPMRNDSLDKDVEPVIALLRRVMDEVSPSSGRFAVVTKFFERLFAGGGEEDSPS